MCSPNPYQHLAELADALDKELDAAAGLRTTKLYEYLLRAALVGRDLERARCVNVVSMMRANGVLQRYATPQTDSVLQAAAENICNARIGDDGLMRLEECAPPPRSVS